MIEINGLSKAYEKGKPVLQNINIAIRDGSVFGLVGINGAGKSTLLRLISGVLRADAGEILVDGENVYENEKAKAEIFFLPDDPYYTSNVTANQLAQMYRAAYSFDNEAFLKYLTTFKLDPNKPIRNFSKGMKRQVFVALGLAVKPKYLLLDEAFDGLDPLARLVLKRALIELVEEKNTSVIISSHSLRELEDFCDSYGLIDGGEISSSGDLAENMHEVRKFQIAFDRAVAPEELGFAYMSYSQKGRVAHVVARGDAEEMKEKILALNPIFVEELEVDFEELFIGEVESRGYLK